MFNPNTSKYWNKKIVKTIGKISISPIFIQKNKYVLNSLNNVTGKVLDIGVGYGYIERLIENNRLNLQMHGIDISNFAISNVRKTVVGIFKVGNITKIPFRNNMFDVVLALDILEHLTPDQFRKALSEIKRVLIKNGELIISVPINETVEDSTKNGHLVRFNSHDIESKLIVCGFDVVRHKKYYAFTNIFFIKNLIFKVFNIGKPNLLILICKKR